MYQKDRQNEEDPIRVSLDFLSYVLSRLMMFSGNRKLINIIYFFFLAI